MIAKTEMNEILNLWEWQRL